MYWTNFIFVFVNTVWVQQRLHHPLCRQEIAQEGQQGQGQLLTHLQYLSENNWNLHCFVLASEYHW